MGLGAVVKHLQEVSSDGAPLLFHAASSRREHSCFSTTRDLINAVLGEGGLMGQAETLDGMGRGILMHAARSKDVCAFREALDLHTEATGSGTRVVMGQFDHVGMSCLHHAAEAGCYEVLREVIAKLDGAGGSFCEEMNKADGFQRTPVMLVLRNAWGGDGHAGGPSSLKDKFDLLLEALPYGPALACGGHNKIGWMEPVLVPSYRVQESTTRPGPRADTRAVTELIHAVRGGLPALQLALNNPLPASRTGFDGGFTVDLDEALAVEAFDDDNGWMRTDETRTWGRALLMAAAAARGDIDVLHRVLVAIEVSHKALETKNNPSTGVSFETRRYMVACESTAGMVAA